MKKNFKVIISYIVLFALIIFSVAFLMGDRTTVEDPVLSDIVGYFEKDAVIRFEVDEKHNLTMEVAGPDATYGEDGKLLTYDGEKLMKVKYQLSNLSLFQSLVDVRVSYDGAGD